jgi:hypothetical protein
VPNALVEVSDGHSAPTLADGTFSIALSPGNYQVHVTGPSCTPTADQLAVVVANGTTFFNKCISGSPNLILKSEVVSGGNGNGIIDRNECNRLTVTLSNIGCAKDSGITGTLSSSTPGVAVDPTPVSFGDIGATATGASSPAFEVSTSPSFVCGTVVNFVMTTNSSSGAHSFPFNLPSCVAPTSNITGTVDNTDPTQNARLFRDGVASNCASPKAACPGTTGTGTRHYDSYNFTNNGGVTACVKVELAAPCVSAGVPGAFTTAYLGSFDPTNICTNYLADAGSSTTGTASYFFNLPAGQTAVVVVNEVNSGGGCANYNLKVSGLFSNADGGGVCPAVTELSPVQEWIGLKNSDDVGTNFDLKAEVYKNTTLIGSGETLNVSGGSSGFNNAKNRAVALALSQSNVSFLAGDKLSIKLYVKVTAVGGHRSGTARLWFNDAQADTHFDATINGTTNNWYIRAGGGLETTPGAGPKTTIDVFSDRLVGGNPYKLFGTWTHTF